MIYQTTRASHYRDAQLARMPLVVDRPSLTDRILSNPYLAIPLIGAALAVLVGGLGSLLIWSTTL